MKVGLICIAKDEDNYIDEWIKYHLKIGFDDIYIYRNNWEFSYEHENVHITKMNGKKKQIVSYNDGFQKYKSQYDWIAFFDVDEFLVLKKHKNVKDFLSEYSDYDSVGINWCLFGDNGLDSVIDNNYSLIKRFTKRKSSVNPHIKSIVNTKFNGLIDIHHAVCQTVDTNFKKFKGSRNYDGDNEIAQINHYFCKTKEEFLNKINRGRPGTDKLRTFDEFDSHNYNEVEDLWALNFMYGN